MVAVSFRVLVIEDEQGPAFDLANLVRIWGMEALVACDPASALRFAEAAAPQVILLDLGMPKMDGLQIARELRARPECKSALLVAVTGFNDEEHKQAAKEAGIDVYLVKPVDVAELKELLWSFQDRTNGQLTPRVVQVPDAIAFAKTLGP